MCPRPSVRRLLLAGLLVCSLAAVGGQPAAAGAHVRIASVYPNPTADGDAGERMTVEFRAPTNVSGWTVTDGETVAAFPNVTLSGRVVATTEPDAVPPGPGNATLVHLRGRLALANAGETVVLRRPEGIVATVTYLDAPEGRQYVRTADGWTWRTPGATDLPVATARDVPAELFVLPDSPSVPVETLRSARERVLLAGYTFASGRVATALCAVAEGGVRVEVLVEGEPIGGVTTRQVDQLDRLSACGVPISVLGGPGDRYAVHHAKYAVVDDRALVLSENWKPAGVGGRSSRGWGVLLHSKTVAGALAETFRADAGFRDARPWRAVRADVEPVEEPAANGSFQARFAPAAVEVDRVDVLVAPDNAEAGLVGLLDGAERSVDVQQVTLSGLDGPMAGAAVRAAERGVETRVLLSSAWYAATDNRPLVERLNERGRREGLPLSARLLRPRSRFVKSHVKALLVDGEVAVVGSLNWNARAARRNREVVVVLHDGAAAAYYGRVFEADWRGGTWRLPAGFGLATALVCLAGSAVLGRRVAFAAVPSGTGPW